MGSDMKCCPRVFHPRSLVFFFFYFQYQVTAIFKTMQTAAVFSFFSLPALFPWSPILGGSLSLYTSFQSILTLHLLIVQVITRVLVPSATFPNPLWVATTKAALFRGPFLINAARTLVRRIKCRGDSFSLNCSYTIPPCASYCTHPFFEERSGRLPLTTCYSFLLDSEMPMTKSSSATSLGHLDFHHMSSNIFLSSARALGPAQSGPGSPSSLTPQLLNHKSNNN